MPNMPWVYQPRDSLSDKFKPDCCAASVNGGSVWRTKQCGAKVKSRAALPGSDTVYEWCGKHDPVRIAAKQDEQQKARDQEYQRRKSEKEADAAKRKAQLDLVDAVLSLNESGPGSGFPNGGMWAELVKLAKKAKGGS